MRAPRRVTFVPMGMPSRILKPAIDFFARVIWARWPVMMVSSSTARSSARAFDLRVADAHVDGDLLDPRDAA